MTHLVSTTRDALVPFQQSMQDWLVAHSTEAHPYRGTRYSDIEERPDGQEFRLLVHSGWLADQGEEPDWPEGVELSGEFGTEWDQPEGVEE